MKKTNNKGFSLVELIVVIAIMAVLIGVLAPQFLKYVSNSKISTDLQNAESLRTTVNTLVADGKLAGTSVTVTGSTAAVTTAPTSVAAANDLSWIMYTVGSKVAPKYNTGASFVVTYTATSGVSKVEYVIPTGQANAGTYECYPNADQTAASGVNAGLNTLKK